MFDIKTDSIKNTETVYLKGRIDSSNSAQAEQFLINSVQGFTGELILDAEGLEYISSAGLRVILKLKKMNGSAKIINASSEVYDIFDMTGFTEMMDISKAYRNISIDGCEVIGEGANGKVYRIDPDTIVKVYKNHDALDEIKNERELARKAFVLGVPTAIPYDVVRVGELYGSVFELLNAKSFAKLLTADNSSADSLAKDSADILKTIHSIILKPGELPDKKAEALIWAEFCSSYLPSDIAERLIKLINDVPDCYNMLHGDFHIKNIMRQNGENLLIDMDTLSMGHPVFEFAAVYLAYKGFSCIDHNRVKEFLGISYETADVFWHSTLKYYFGTENPEKLAEIESKAAVICYARILRRTVRKAKETEDYKKKLIEYCINYLTENVPKIDSLYF